MTLVPFFEIPDRVWDKNFVHRCHIHILSHPWLTKAYSYKFEQYLFKRQKTSFTTLAYKVLRWHSLQFWRKFLTFRKVFIQVNWFILSFKCKKMSTQCCIPDLNDAQRFSESHCNTVSAPIERHSGLQLHHE